MKNYKNLNADAVATAGLPNVQLTEGKIYEDAVIVTKANLAELKEVAAGGALSEWSTQDLPEGTNDVILLAIESRKSKAPKDPAKSRYFVAKCSFIKGKHFVVTLSASMVDAMLDRVGKSVKITKAANGETYTSAKGIEYPSYSYNFQGELAVKA